jgi:adsorption protein B
MTEMIKASVIQYLWFVETATIATAVLIALSSIDDVFVDIYYWAMKLRGSIGVNIANIPPASEINGIPERPFAFIVPAWKEQDVIFSMLSTNSRLVVYEEAYYFVGAYQNDELTQIEVRKAQQLYKNIQLVIVPRDGPTSKADCLNEIIAAILQYEARYRMEFAGIVMHDSEDLIHPHELKAFNVLTHNFDFIQLPVFSFARPLSSMVTGIYLDEFAEVHTKDLQVRQSLSGVIPCAGVSACFSREAMTRLVAFNSGEAFRTTTFTEDYDIAFRVSELGLKSAFVSYPTFYTIDVDLNTETPAVFKRTFPVSTREYFPSEFYAAYRQRARWQLGIVFQGIKELGWKGSWATKYFLARDRKGIITGPTVMMGYFIALNLLLIGAYFAYCYPDEEVPFSLLATPLAANLFLLNMGFLVWRLMHRAIFTWIVYDWRQAVMSLPRLVVANFVNFFATVRAVRTYTTHLITGKALVWDKTSHSYPVPMVHTLPPDRRPLPQDNELLSSRLRPMSVRVQGR